MPSAESLAGLEIPTLQDTGRSESASVNPADVADPGPPVVKRPAKQKDVPLQPFIVGEGLPAVPAKLVAKIQRGEYVDMAELLKDNIEAERRRTPQEGLQGGQISRSNRREVPDLLSWLQCFGTYACVFCEAFPEKRKELWAYQTFLIRESRRCDGEGWRDYDSMFRQQVASAADLEWARVNNSLFAVTFLAQSSGRGKACKWCQETDHKSDGCALAPERPIRGEPPMGDKKVTPGDGRSWRLKAERICYSWNEGRCAYHPYCRFRHVCANTGCQGDHRAVDCCRQTRIRQGESRRESQPEKAR